MPALPGELHTRAPPCCLTDHTCHRTVGAGSKPAPDGVLMRRTMGANRAPHHAGRRPAHPGHPGLYHAGRRPTLPGVYYAGRRPALPGVYHAGRRPAHPGHPGLYHAGRRPAHPSIYYAGRRPTLPGGCVGKMPAHPGLYHACGPEARAPRRLRRQDARAPRPSTTRAGDPRTQASTMRAGGPRSQAAA
jgi:hypothetical protein